MAAPGSLRGRGGGHNSGSTRISKGGGGHSSGSTRISKGGGGHSSGSTRISKGGGEGGTTVAAPGSLRGRGGGAQQWQHQDL